MQETLSNHFPWPVALIRQYSCQCDVPSYSNTNNFWDLFHLVEAITSLSWKLPRIMAFIWGLPFIIFPHLPRVLHLLDEGLRLVGVDFHHRGVGETIQLGSLVVQVNVLVVVPLENILSQWYLKEIFFEDISPRWYLTKGYSTLMIFYKRITLHLDHLSTLFPPLLPIILQLIRIPTIRHHLWKDYAFSQHQRGSGGYPDPLPTREL